MKIVKCDKCGSETKDYRTVNIQNYISHLGNTVTCLYVEYPTYDLCPKCNEEFNRYISNSITQFMRDKPERTQFKCEDCIYQGSVPSICNDCLVSAEGSGNIPTKFKPKPEDPVEEADALIDLCRSCKYYKATDKDEVNPCKDCRITKLVNSGSLTSPKWSAVGSNWAAKKCEDCKYFNLDSSVGPCMGCEEEGGRMWEAKE